MAQMFTLKTKVENTDFFDKKRLGSILNLGFIVDFTPPPLYIPILKTFYPQNFESFFSK